MERWRIFGLTTLLTALFLACLFLVAEAGRARMRVAAEQMQHSMARRILLVLSAMLMAHATLRRHRVVTQQVERRREELEVEAAARATELNEVYGQLRTVQEQERSRLARGLHDELGGLLLAARMDATWLQHRGSDADARARQLRLRRLVEALDQGIDLKRRVIEKLRPTLLDNMGLVAAVRWQVNETCTRAGIRCTCQFPGSESVVDPQTGIVLFRVVQEALANVVKHARTQGVDVTLEVCDSRLLLVVADDGAMATGGKFTPWRA